MVTTANQSKRTNWKDRMFETVLYTMLGVLAFIIVYPFVHVLSVSLSDRGEALRAGFHFYPRVISFEAYKDLFGYDLVWSGYGNTLFRMVFGTALGLVVSMFAAYPLSRSSFPMRRLLTLAILFTMIFDVGLVPNYLLMKEYGLLNNRWVYVLPYSANAFHVLVMLSFFRTVPPSLLEAAKIDGARDVRILWRIIVPLSAPVFVTIALWSLVFHINSFTDNLLYVSDKSKFVLQQIVREIVIDNRLDDFSNSTSSDPPAPESLKMATVIVSMLPVLLLYPFLLRYFEKGTMIGSVKG